MRFDPHADLDGRVLAARICLREAQGCRPTRYSSEGKKIQNRCAERHCSCPVAYTRQQRHRIEAQDRPMVGSPKDTTLGFMAVIYHMPDGGQAHSSAAKSGDSAPLLHSQYPWSMLTGTASLHSDSRVQRSWPVQKYCALSLNDGDRTADMPS